MCDFNYKLLGKEIKKRFKTNKLFMIALNNAGVEIKEDAIKKWRQGYTTPKTIYLSTICKLLKIDPNLLFCKEDTIIQTDNSYIELPTIHAGAGAEAFGVEYAEKRAFPRELIPPQIALDENLLLMVVVGNSMEPLYYENDIVFIDMVNGREFLHVNGTYLVRYGNTVQIKDVEFLGNGDILLMSRNSKAIIQPVKDLGVEWEIVGKPYATLHPTVGSKLRLT
jgi:phage repressor protein C with HTH and peptisase S24 domain